MSRGSPAPVAAMVLGIGNELRGDDGVGPEVARRLSGRCGVPVVNAGEVPENYLDLVRARSPERVLLIDAADFGGAPGDTALVRLDVGETTSSRLPTTHCASLSVFARYLRTEIGTEVWLLGIQPASLEFGRPLSAPVAGAVERATAMAETWTNRRPDAREE